MDRKKILDWMVKRNIRNIDDVGKIMNQFYLDRKILEALVNKNVKPNKFLNKK